MGVQFQEEIKWDKKLNEKNEKDKLNREKKNIEEGKENLAVKCFLYEHRLSCLLFSWSKFLSKMMSWCPWVTSAGCSNSSLDNESDLDTWESG